MTIDIPDDRLNQVAAAMRSASNEFHGTVAREPDHKLTPSWRRSAQFFDALADTLYRAARDCGQPKAITK